MSAPAHLNSCDKAELLCAYVIQALPAEEVSAVEAHVASCPHCRRELDALRPVLDALGSFPANVLRPAASLQQRLAQRIAQETGADTVPPPKAIWREPAWEEVAPGILCKLLASDAQRHRVSMLVRLLPGAEYPPHTHAEFEELHLLDGELWIDGRKLYPGDYNRAETAATDKRVWSETGCTCVLITSTRDLLR
jgi:anti-sigma factor ChrR (cupin superfamily)